jgi:hypothetical protein
LGIWGEVDEKETNWGCTRHPAISVIDRGRSRMVELRHLARFAGKLVLTRKALSWSDKELIAEAHDNFGFRR